jgi:hypothetical protein
LKVAVLGAGLQGCSIALALANRGTNVVLFERGASIMTRTAIANEGKIHLGWMYAADPTLETARTMIEGALAFAPFLGSHLGLRVETLATSQPAAYAVHRDSQHSGDTVRAYFGSVHALLVEASAERPRAYFGADLSMPPREWSAEQRDAAFDPDHVEAVFDTPEVAIDPLELAHHVAAAVRNTPRIEVRTEHEVVGASVDGMVTARSGGGERQERFDHVVNALWESRLAIDATAGIRPERPWLHRLKYGVGFTWPSSLPRPPSATFVSGPFGEVVSYPDSTTYLTWYPSCVTEMSRELSPPFWEANPGDPLRSKIARGTLDGLAKIVRALEPVRNLELDRLWVKGGPIFAWGQTDIDDPLSELHSRYRIGIHSTRRYHSVDPGKLTMAPYFAEQCASRLIELGTSS